MTPSTTAITFSVQMGSGGHAIAQAVADELGYRFYDREVIVQAAQMSGVSAETIATAERWPSFIHRMMERLTATTLSDGLMISPYVDPALTMRTSADYRALLEQVVRKLAAEGNCVIVGHAGQVILKDDPSVFKVLIHGAAGRRAERLALEEGSSLDEARGRIETDDGERAKFFKCAYSTNLLSSSGYDLTINTDDVTPETAGAWILAGVENRRGVLTPA